MSKFEKRLLKFLANPGSLEYFEIEILLARFGCEKVHGKGSHRKFTHKKLPYHLTIALHGHDCKTIYKIEAANFIHALRELE